LSISKTRREDAVFHGEQIGGCSMSVRADEHLERACRRDLQRTRSPKNVEFIDMPEFYGINTVPYGGRLVRPCRRLLRRNHAA
jgi:hypothetical protein